MWGYNQNLSITDPCTKVINSNFLKNAYVSKISIFIKIFAICEYVFVLCPQHEIVYVNFLFLGEVNPGYVNEAQSVAGSRKSLSLRPVLLVAPPEQDRYSELSRAKSHSHHSLYTPAPSHPAHTMSTNTLNHSQHNFQL